MVRDKRTIWKPGSNVVEEGKRESWKCDGRIGGRGRKAEAISGDSTRQECRGQTGSVRGNQADDRWIMTCVAELWFWQPHLQPYPESG